MAATPDSETLKHEALETLREARAAISGDIARIRRRMQPRRILQRGVDNHLWLIAGCAGLLGFIAARGIATRLQSDHSGRRASAPAPRPQRKTPAIAASALWMAFKPFIGLAGKHLAAAVFRRGLSGESLFPAGTAATDREADYKG